MNETNSRDRASGTDSGRDGGGGRRRRLLRTTTSEFKPTDF